MSSYDQIKGLKVVPGEIRDFFNVHVIAADDVYDLWREHNVIGLDMIIHNRGAAALDINIDQEAPVTVDPGDTFSMSDIKFSLVVVTTAVNTNIVLAGVRREPEIARRELTGRL